MRYGAVIVAAGMSRRMKDFKQLMKIGDMTFAERVITNFQRAGVQDIVIVTAPALCFFGMSSTRPPKCLILPALASHT